MQIAELRIQRDKLPIIFENIYLSDIEFTLEENNLILGLAHSILHSGVNTMFDLSDEKFEAYRNKIKTRTETSEMDFDSYMANNSKRFYLYHLLFTKPLPLKNSVNTNGMNYVANFYKTLFDAKRGASNRVFIEDKELTCKDIRAGIFLDRYRERSYEEAIVEICKHFSETEGNKYPNAQMVSELYIKGIADVLNNEQYTPQRGDQKMSSSNLEDLLKNGVRQIILTGAPGTGKTYTAFEAAKSLGHKYKLIQFHPSYDYTDFVEGLRPIEKSGEMIFKKVDGIFKGFCRQVVAWNKECNDDIPDDGEELYFFIIDEINRADLSKVLGELMFGLERDKRGAGNKFPTQYQNLKTFDVETNAEMENDEFAAGFYIPHNVVIIGTMNDIDRSVESFDFALRRRFTWVEVKANDVLEAGLQAVFKQQTHLNHSDVSEIVFRIENLNAYISETGKKYSLNDSYHISHGYFANLPSDLKSTDEILDYVWTYRLRSLITEYVRGEHLAEKFLMQCEETFKKSSREA